MTEDDDDDDDAVVDDEARACKETQAQENVNRCWVVRQGMTEICSS